MGLESLPLVVFLLLPGFLSWFIFCWGTVTRKLSQFQHLSVSLILSILAFTIGYYIIYLSWDITPFPAYIQILNDPDILPPELGIAIYLTAIILGFLLIRIYKSENVRRLLDWIGLDLFRHEDAWYRLFHKGYYVTVYLKDGNIVSGWPTYYSETGDKGSAELYLTKMHYYQKEKERWVRSSRSVDGLLINRDLISHIEVMKPEVVRETETGGSQVMRTTWLHWVEFGARFIVWASVIGFAILTVLGVLPILPKPTSLMLIILLYLFMVAALVQWIFDIRRLYPPRRQ